MSEKEEFSLEKSEELIAHLKSGTPSEFEQLRSTLNLLAHVPELSPVALPPVLPSSINQPVPLVPVKSRKPRRTIITSIIVTGTFASFSLAAAAVTGIGPAPIVDVGHQTAKFVRGVVGAITHVVTGNSASGSENQPANPQTPVAVPTPSNSNASSGNSNDGQGSESSLPIPPLPGPLTPSPSEAKSGQDGNKDGKSHEGETPKPTPTHESEAPHPQDSQVVIAPTLTIPKGEKEHTDSEGHTKPSLNPTPTPSPSPVGLPSSGETEQPESND